MNFTKLTLGTIFAIVVVTLFSCKSEKDKYVEERDKAMDEAWLLLDYAEKCAEVDMSVPLGFTLGCTEQEFVNHCDKLGKRYGGQEKDGMYQLRTDEFEVCDSVLISYFNYFSDPNTKTDIVDEVSFLLKDIGTFETDDIDKVICILDKKLNGWDQAEFNATDDKPSTKYEDYHKFWVRNNIAVHLEVTFKTTIISFINIPKHGTEWIKEWIDKKIEISEEVSKSKEEIENLPKIVNSVWDGSVYQVKNYLEDNLKDPDSYEGIEWSKVQETTKGSYTVRHKFRAKNSFGAMVIESWVFELDREGNVISAKQL